MIELRNLSWDNWEECLKLEVNDYQKSFVAPNTLSVAQAYVHLTNDKTPPRKNCTNRLDFVRRAKLKKASWWRR